jgi:hypothetical protein
VPRSLPDGIYEHPVTDELAAALVALEPFRVSVVRDLGDDDAPAVMARHLGKEQRHDRIVTQERGNLAQRTRSGQYLDP